MTTQPQFHPFDRVLVRDTPQDIWQPKHYFRHQPPTDISGPHQTTDNHYWNYCIPYADNQHLCGTNHPARPWKPAKGEPYYIVARIHGGLFHHETRRWGETTSDTIDYQSGNCFRHEQQARQAADHINQAFRQYLRSQGIETTY